MMKTTLKILKKKTKLLKLSDLGYCQGNVWNSNLLNDNKKAFKIFSPSLEPYNVEPRNFFGYHSAHHIYLLASCPGQNCMNYEVMKFIYIYIFVCLLNNHFLYGQMISKLLIKWSLELKFFKQIFKER